MKVAAIVLAIAASSAAAVFAEENIRVMGARDTLMTHSGIDVKIATKDILNKPTALVNKNTLAIGNNVFVTRSNLVFLQNDKLVLARKVEELVIKSTEADTAAVLSKNVLKAISAPDMDATMMTKASAVVAARGGDMSTLRQRIADLLITQADRVNLTTRIEEMVAKAGEAGEAAVLSKNILRVISAPTTDSAMMSKASAVVDTKGSDSAMLQQRIADLLRANEQVIQSQSPRGITVLIGTKDILRQPTAVVNKNVALSDNQIAISNSQLTPQKNDAVTLRGAAKVADMIAPASAITVTKREGGDDSELYRVGFVYETKTKADNQEQWGLGFGWSYPMGYWNLYGAGLYGGGCGLGFGYGGYYYC
jgi:DNA-directed RNA polymerase subunit E'/Rpb7|uniref:Uncharacterized protein n=1 Tax=Globisporangium ultimum (strain ATCC 200006 / CBS 805.95 / DAOM BR144) TaxID=431595 RepID=K3WI39_GLOUD